MSPERLTAFSDGVIAIIITIMVLEIKVPGETSGDTFQTLVPMVPLFLAYAFSFVYVAIFWNNHHHLFKSVKSINGAALWANNALLFFLSLIPVTTAWMGEHINSPAPIALYGIDFMLCAATWRILVIVLTRMSQNKKLAKGISSDRKGIASIFINILGIGLSFVKPFLGLICYLIVLFIWIVPDKRLESDIIKDEE